MISLIRKKLTYSNAIAGLALFVALGGVAVAANLRCLRVLDDVEVEFLADAAAGDPEAVAALERYRFLRQSVSKRE